MAAVETKPHILAPVGQGSSLTSMGKHPLKDFKMGFKASQGKDYTLVSQTATINFPTVECDVEGLYDRETGIFTAPVNGVYTLSSSITQVGDGAVASHVRRKSKSLSRMQRLCNLQCSAKGSSSTKTCLVWLLSGDELWAYADKIPDFECSFACYLNSC